MIYFSSDYHFFHDNIRRLCNRPFDSVESMNRALLDNINQKVMSNDILWILGDVLWWKFNEKDYLANAKIIRNGINAETVNVITGNHDKRPDLLEAAGFRCLQYHEMKINKQHLVLFHYPMLSFNGKSHGSIHLHGHTHAKIPFDPKVRRLDVGVDNLNYQAISLDEVIEYMNNNCVSDWERYP